MVWKGISPGLFSGLLVILAISSWHIFHLCIFFGEVSVQIFCPSLKLGYILLILLRYKNSFILDINLLWDIYALWIFFFSSPQLFIFLLVFYKEQKVLTLMKFKIWFSLMVYASPVPSKKYLPTTRSMIHFKIILCMV